MGIAHRVNGKNIVASLLLSRNKGAVALKTKEVPSPAKPPLPACGRAELHAFRAGNCSFRFPDQSWSRGL
jgi:hypothetical protein